MRLASLPIAALAISLLATTADAAFVWRGNDTGGLIPWRPDLRRIDYLDIAERYCGFHRKLARITSVHPRYGDYVVFACAFPRGYDPVRQGTVPPLWPLWAY
jgi:hypothetical protein